jgi:hypothetical protein
MHDRILIRAGSPTQVQFCLLDQSLTPIGSGTVESAVKQCKSRLTDPSWSRSTAELMLLLQAAILSDDFDRLWKVA